MQRKSHLGLYTLLLVAAIIACGALSGIRGTSHNEQPPHPARVAFDLHDPIQFQQHCGDAQWRKAFNRADGMPKALSIFYKTQSFGVGQTGVMVMFGHSKKDDPLGVDYSNVTFFSLPSDRVIDEPLALKMLACTN